MGDKEVRVRQRRSVEGCGVENGRTRAATGEGMAVRDSSQEERQEAWAPSAVRINTLGLTVSLAEAMAEAAAAPEAVRKGTRYGKGASKEGREVPLSPHPRKETAQRVSAAERTGENATGWGP